MQVKAASCSKKDDANKTILLRETWCKWNNIPLENDAGRNIFGQCLSHLLA